MTENKRYNVSFPPELEAKIIALRKTDEFCRMSFSEIIRMLAERGLKGFSTADNLLTTDQP